MSTRAPDVMEHVVGYRVWRLRRDGRLVSAGLGATIWQPGVNVAACDESGHTAPAGDCVCGLYAFHGAPPAPSPGTVGAIRAHGQLESHATGFRAQYAEVVALVQRRRRPRRRELRAAAMYDVPLVALPELEDVARTHGRPLAAGQRPARERDEVLDAHPRLRRVHDALEHAYARFAGALRRRPSVRSFALAAMTFAPGMTVLAWGLLAALAARGEHVSSSAVKLALLPMALALVGHAARAWFGSGWLRPVRRSAVAVVLLLAVPLQFAGDVGVSGLAVEALSWAVGLTAVAVIFAGLGHLHRPVVVCVTVAWISVLGVALPWLWGQTLLVLAGAAIAQYALVFPARARWLIRGVGR